MHKATWEPDEDLRSQFMDDAEKDPTDYILAPGDEEESTVASGKERWMLCCISAARQQCCIRASCAALHALLH